MSHQGSQTPSAQPSPADFKTLQGLIGGYRVSQAIRAAIELGISDRLTAGATTIENLAASVGAHEGHLFRLMRFLEGAGLYQESAPRSFSLTPMGRALCQEVPGSPASMARMWLHEFQWQPWGQLLDAVKTGRTAFDSLHGVGLFSYLQSHPDLGQMFDRAMTERTAYDAVRVAASYDFSKVALLADIGGGQGVMLASLVRANPAMRGILFDQPNVVARAPAVLDSAGVSGRCQVIGGSFFEHVPQGASLYLLARVIHDWDDETASKILGHVRAAMAPDAKVLLYERLVEPDYRATMSVLHLDLEMMVILGGMERTEREFRALLERSGLAMTRILPVVGAPDFRLIEASAK